MDTPYQLFVALRYLKSRKRHRSISLNTLISTGGVALGVMALLVVMSVMSGFHEDLQKKILGVNTHVVVLDYSGEMPDYESVMQKTVKDPRVRAASPFVLGQVMVASSGKAQGVYLRGIEPSLEIKTTDIQSHMKRGSLMDMDRAEGAPGIVLGSELSDRLGARVGDIIKVISPFGGQGPMGALPKVKKFELVGIFEVGMYEYDSNLALTGLAPAQDFMELEGAVTGVQLNIENPADARIVARDIKNALGHPFYTKDWIDMNKNLFAALKLEKLAMFVILTLIVLVAAFNIISTQTMNVIEKEAEIAILKAMGATRRGIMSVFMIQGFVIGLIGTIIGLSCGWFLSYMIDTYHIIKLPADVYYLSHLPAKIKPWDFLAVSVSAVAISFLATVYPARQAGGVNPIEPLRYE